MTAVSALPDHITILREHLLVIDVLQELAVTLFMLLFDSGHTLEFLGDLVEALLASLLSHAGIHVGPLKVLTTGGIFKILHRVAHLTAVQQFIPHLGMFLLVGRCFFKDSGNLYIAVFLGL